MITWKVGDVVRVAHACLESPAGSVALVVEVYDRRAIGAGDGLGITLLFANGNYDGFSADDVLAWGVERLGHAPGLAAYRFTSAVRLYDDWRRGLFDDLWQRGWV